MELRALELTVSRGLRTTKYLKLVMVTATL